MAVIEPAIIDLAWPRWHDRTAIVCGLLGLLATSPIPVLSLVSLDSLQVELDEKDQVRETCHPAIE